MKLLDQITLELKAGNGGNGKVSFFQDWHQKRQYPDGGNGGNGGNIIFLADRRLTTFHFPQTRLVAQAGENGRHKTQHGKTAPDLILRVPIGTLLWTADRQFFLCDFTLDQQQFVVANGGLGGKGNAAFLSNLNRFPNTAQPGMLGESKRIFLELKLLANIGLLGLPNAGKTSLLNVLTKAKAKTGNYFFTTLQPNLGVFANEVVISDLPGIITGAHLNRGLGNQFLKHAERCQLLAYVVDLAVPFSALIRNFRNILAELFSYNELFHRIPLVIIGNKLDLPSARENCPQFAQFLAHNYPQWKFFPVSALTGVQLPLLIKNLLATYHNLVAPATVLGLSLQNHAPQQLFEYKIHREIRLQKLRPNTWYLSGKLITELNHKYDLQNPTERMTFNRHLKKLGVETLLLQQNVRSGDTIFINQLPFTWKPVT